MWGRGSQKDVLNPQILIPVILPEDRVPICSREGISILFLGVISLVPFSTWARS